MAKKVVKAQTNNKKIGEATAKRIKSKIEGLK